MSRLGGLWRAMPWTASLFALGATAIAGLPPLNGFVSEWLVYLGLFDAVGGRGTTACAAVFAAVALGVTGALALACFVKVCGVVFLGQARSELGEDVHECGWRMRLPMLAIGTACATIGLAPVLFWPALTVAASAWQPGMGDAVSSAPLVQLGAFHLALAAGVVLGVTLLWAKVRRNGMSRAETWGCGYHAPTPRIQYTAGSFAWIITGWFGWILRPERHSHLPQGTFPAHADFEEHTPETVLEGVVEPTGLAVMRVSTAVRRLQHGRVQSYIFYLLLGLAALAILAVTKGVP
jgi:hydrogenase-4 component B